MNWGAEFRSRPAILAYGSPFDQQICSSIYDDFLLIADLPE